MVVMRIHRDVFPRTDHGYTWVECIWFVRDGRKVRPTIPSAGCCERLGRMPGGPLLCDFDAEMKHYVPEGVARTEKTETVHDDAFYRVGTVSITRDSDPS